MERKDAFFFLLLAAVAVWLISLGMKQRTVPAVVANEDAADMTNVVGASLSPDCDPPVSSPFKGRYPVPPPLMSMLPSTSADAVEGTALNQKGYH